MEAVRHEEKKSTIYLRQRSEKGHKMRKRNEETNEKKETVGVIKKGERT